MTKQWLLLPLILTSLFSSVSRATVPETLDRITVDAGSFFENLLHAGECKDATDNSNLFSSNEKPEAFRMTLANGKSIRMIPVGLLFPSAGDSYKVAMRYLIVAKGKLDYRIGVFFMNHGKIEMRNEKSSNQRIEVQSIEPASNEPFARIDKGSFCDKLKETWPENTWGEIGEVADVFKSDGTRDE